ncbi:phage tail protein [Acidovorax sp. MR-S7]|uniref:phage tail protein n=1 Tax=Acidovorax sp. MR-S7 TaxID=1268622 RepID=UPI000375DCD8|nr:tail fiber protein [Acidovorax sp. MR-S7]GAD24727.1 microcystin-dependent protein [Acidovorax sp. MR-S7]
MRRAALCAAVCAAVWAAPAARASSSVAYVGELMLFGGSFCPQYWLPADGRLMSIAQYQVLYALLGATYGGDGQTTFALPDLRGRAAVGTGQGPGLPNKPLGAQGGVETVALTTAQMPAHSHGLPASTEPATHATPAAGRVPATVQNGGAYASAGTGVPLSSIGAAGAAQPFDVRSPYLAMQWCIATEGLFPSQN